MVVRLLLVLKILMPKTSTPFECRQIRLQDSCFPTVLAQLYSEFKIDYSFGLAFILKTLDSIGNCRRPVFPLGVSQHMYKITILCKFELNWSSKLRDNNESKSTLATRSCVHLGG